MNYRVYSLEYRGSGLRVGFRGIFGCTFEGLGFAGIFLGLSLKV